MSTKNQRRLAAAIMSIGVNRVWIDPERAEDIESAITRAEIRKLVHEGAMKASPEHGQSRYRTRLLHEKKKAGRRKGPGTRKGSKFSVVSRKTRWISKIRSLRGRLQALRSRRTITVNTYRTLYRKAKGGEFRSIAELERYINEQGLRRRTFG
jgi:large subunit ribosomal protein L19e